MLINISKFCGSDTEIFTAAFDFLKKNRGTTLCLESRTYRIETPLRIESTEEITIEGNGATIRFVGNTGGIFIEGAKKTSINNLFIDFEKSSVKNIVIASDQFGFSMRNGGNLNPSFEKFEYDKRIILCDGKEERFLGFLNPDDIISANASFDGSIRVWGDFASVKTQDYLYFTDKTRNDSAFSIMSSEKITLENIYILSCYGDAIKTVNSSSLEYKRVSIVPTPGNHLCSCGNGMLFDDCFTVMLNDCIVEGILGSAFIFTNEKCGEIILSGDYTRNCYAHSLVCPLGNVKVEGCLFDAGKDTALVFYTDPERCGETIITHNRINHRGEKYRFPVIKNAGGIVINANSDKLCSNIKIMHNTILSVDTASAIYINCVNNISVFGNEILSLHTDKEIVFENCNNITEEGNRR